MAPKDIKSQTDLIVGCLLEDGLLSDKGLVEPDGVGEGELEPVPADYGRKAETYLGQLASLSQGAQTDEAFDPALIASKLRQLGDDYDEKVIQPLINNVRQAAADQVVAAFEDSVDSLCKSWVAETPEVAPEKQLLRASVTLGLYVKRKCPDLVGAVQSAMTDFLNARLGTWVTEQGGWDEVASH